MNRYPAHLHSVAQRTIAALSATGFDHLLIASGTQKYHFLDDRPYPFRANPHFSAWLPLPDHANGWIAFTPGQRPKLAYHQPDDYWHVAPQAPSGEWVEHFDITIITAPEQATALLPKHGRVAIIGDHDAGLPGMAPNNPPELLARLHFARAVKTDYELDCIRAAQKRAVRGHRAAHSAFLGRASERDIHLAYLTATGHTDVDLPYGNIVALNAHGAVLHYQRQSADTPEAHRSLLIDAGAEHRGYAADITRTWGNGDSEFQSLIEAVDGVQRRLVDQVRAGVDYAALHVSAHLALGGVLEQLGIVRMAPEDQLARRITHAFFPHGLGHLLGLQVHDVGGLQRDPSGGEIPRPDGHPHLRLTRSLEPGMVVTIEPGIYFIDSLLAPLCESPDAGRIDWQAVDRLRPFGGVRIEDDVACTDGDPENLTRDAFAAG